MQSTTVAVVLESLTLRDKFNTNPNSSIAAEDVARIGNSFPARDPPRRFRYRQPLVCPNSEVFSHSQSLHVRGRTMGAKVWMFPNEVWPVSAAVASHFRDRTSRFRAKFRSHSLVVLSVQLMFSRVTHFPVLFKVSFEPRAAAVQLGTTACFRPRLHARFITRR